MNFVWNKMCLLLALLLLSSTVFAQNEINVDMFVGEVKVLGVFTVQRVAIGDGKVLRVEVKDDGEIILIAQSKGSSSIRLWQNDGQQLNYNVRVAASDPRTRVRMEDMVRMNVKIIEVRKSALRDVGIDWVSNSEGIANGPAFSTAGDVISNNLFRVDGNSGISEPLPLNVRPFSTHFGIATSITSQIKYLASSGDAITLAEPNLSCVNGGSANFLAGGEVPYPVTDANGGRSVQFKEYGIKLNISPQVDANGHIFADLLTEVSQIDQAVSVLGAPGILTRRTQTQVNVISGQTIVISGLLSAEQSKDISKVALLGDIPVLGQLFKSRNFRNNLSELVIFVTPEVVSPLTHKMRDNEMQLYQYQDKVKSQLKSKLNFNLME